MRRARELGVYFREKVSFLIYCFMWSFIECFGLFGAFVVTAYSFVGRFFTVVERGQCSEM